MKILRVNYQGVTFHAELVDQSSVACLNKELGFDAPIALRDVGVLPAVWPTKIVCACGNYRSRAEESGRGVPDEPVLMLKPPSSVIANGEDILLPPASKNVEFQGELAVVIGQGGRNIKEEDAARHIFGYTCANDVTARDMLERDGRPARAKGFDTFSPVGPWVESGLDSVADLGLQTVVNGEVRQSANTSDMIYSPARLVSFVSSIMTLYPGDLILTGSPAGAGPLAPGDEVRIEIEGIGQLINTVRTDDGRPRAPRMV